MQHSTLALVLATGSVLAATACTTNSNDGRLVTAPVSSAAPQAAPAPSSIAAAPSVPSVPSAPSAPSASGVSPGPDADSGAAAFQACQSDSDCVAVPRNGCCHNGWKEAVNVSQQAAYTASFTCPQAHPMCPMYIVHDVRVPRCDVASHLCKMTTR